MARFILIHGAWHGGWCWWKIVDRLRALGHTADAPDLPSHGADTTPPEGITLNDYAQKVCAMLGESVERPILVGHSLGGLTVSQVAELRPEQIAATVYLAAIVPEFGGVAATPTTSDAMRKSIALSADRSVVDFRGDAREVFYGACSKEDVAFAVERLCPQPAAVMVNTPLLTRERFGTVPRTYIECLDDGAIPVDSQREIHTRADFDDVDSIATDHSPFFSRPDDLVAILDRIAGSTQ
jgi:pimeloyl-ACP methyl ester carboxylesterase